MAPPRLRLPLQDTNIDHALRRTVRLVALVNLAYFGIGFAVALAIRSVWLFADSIDFLEDASVNFLIFAALGWSAAQRARVGMALAGILLILGLATCWTAWEKFNAPVPPDTVPLSLVGAGALAINLVCACMLARYRAHQGSHPRGLDSTTRIPIKYQLIRTDTLKSICPRQPYGSRHCCVLCNGALFPSVFI